MNPQQAQRVSVIPLQAPWVFMTPLQVAVCECVSMNTQRFALCVSMNPLQARWVFMPPLQVAGVSTNP